MDQFGSDVPAFNIDGDKKVNTLLGGTVTFALVFIILIFATIKLQETLDRTYRFFQESKVNEHYDSTDLLNLNEINYRIAFSFEGENDNKLKDDPRYVKLLSRAVRRVDNVLSETILSFHKCTSKDWEKFYPIAAKSKALFDKIEQDEDRGFYCLDWSSDPDNFILYGSETTQDY